MCISYIFIPGAAGKSGGPSAWGGAGADVEMSGDDGVERGRATCVGRSRIANMERGRWHGVEQGGAVETRRAGHWT
jgi:hypothetical protein